MPVGIGARSPDLLETHWQMALDVLSTLYSERNLMKTLRSVLFVAVLGISSSTAMAVDVDVQSVWVRGTVPGQKATGAFMEITSKAGATLVGASSPVAGSRT